LPSQSRPLTARVGKPTKRPTATPLVLWSVQVEIPCAKSNCSKSCSASPSDGPMLTASSLPLNPRPIVNVPERFDQDIDVGLATRSDGDSAIPKCCGRTIKNGLPVGSSG